MKALRWILILPAAIGGMVVAAFLLHWILIASCSQSDSTVQLGKESLANTERTMMAPAGPLGFVFAGAITAPKKRVIVSLILGFAILVGCPLAVYWFRDVKGMDLEYGVIEWALQFAGVAAAVAATFAKERKPRVEA